MKNFRLLLKNSIKSLWNSRALVTQFTALTTIATIVVSSISLGNFSLRNSISEIEDKSNASGFSIKSNNLENFAAYNLVNESNKIVQSLDYLTMNDATGEIKVYNPLNNYEQTKTIFNVDNTEYTTYGFFEKYFNDNYTTDPESIKWNNIVFSNTNESLPILTRMIDQKYSNQVSDIFSIYNNLLPPSPTKVQDTNYQIFYNPSIYSLNPWSFTFYKSNNTQMTVNKFGIAVVQDFSDEYKNDIFYNHGIFDNKYSYIVDTDVSYLENEQMSQYKQEMKIINNDIKLAYQPRDAFSNFWKQIGTTSEFKSHEHCVNFVGSSSSIYNNNYWQFLNKLTNSIKTKFMTPSKYFSFNYEIDFDNSTGLAKFFSEIYKNPENPFHQEFDSIFDAKFKKYFTGKIEIPLIPFITVSPIIPENITWTPEQYRDWAANDFLNIEKSKPNIHGITNIIDETFIQLSERSMKIFENKINTVPLEIRNNYYENYDIDYFLSNNMKLNFSKSSNFTISDSNQNTFIVSKNKYFTNEQVNKIVINSGTELFKNRIDNNYIVLDDSITDKFIRWANFLRGSSTVENKKTTFLNDNLFWTIMNIMKELKLNTNEKISNEFYNWIYDVTNLELFKNNFAKWQASTINFLDTYKCSSIVWNGGGYNVDFTRKSQLGIELDFNAIYYEPSSFTTITSLNYSKIKNGSKQIVNSEFVKNAIKLPYKTKIFTQEEILNNSENFKDNFIYNPYTRKLEFYNDFIDWLNRLDSRFKLTVNGDEFVIIGTGINSEFVYPIISDNQLLIDNNSPVLYMNELGYDKIVRNNTVKQNSNYFVNFYNNLNHIGNNSNLNKINEWTKRVYNEKLAYKINDANQPNNLLYLRMNFPYTILSTVLSITLIIASIVILLSFVFIFILMRSIVNQNLNTFAIGMANGINKRKLLFSFIPFVLIPSFISAFLGYGFSFLLYPTISNAIQNYWILDYVKFAFNPGYLVLAFLILALIIFAVQTIVIYIMLSKNVSTLLNTKMEFKYNKLVQHSRKLVKGMSPLASFRITYMLGNIGRFILLLLMMTSFVSLTTISASTPNTFNAAVQKTMDNKQYNYAIDLVTPSEQGGYYYDIPYNLLGTRQKGLTPLYNLNKTDGFYNKGYKDALTYNIPDKNESLIYNNIFLPQTGIVKDVQGSLTFFRNNIVHLLTMDFGINFLGNYINPWEWAKKILPTSITNLVESKLQQQINFAFLYVCWLQKQNNIHTNEKTMWLYNPNSEISFIDSFNGSKNPEKWDQINWLIKLEKINGKFVWKPNQQYLSDGLPNYTVTKQFVNLMTRIISLQNNPYYKKFINELENKQNKKSIDANFMIGLNVVPIIPELDETYTYINATSNLNTKNKNFYFKIFGIKPNTNQLVLWDEYNNKDLKHLLTTYEIIDDIYPLIINEVVAKKYGLRVNQEIEISINNKYERYKEKFQHKPDLTKYKFQIIGITTSKSDEQYYTTQEIANKLLGFKKPKLASEYDLKNGNYDYKWVNQEEIDNFIPFNGVFSKQKLPKMLTNFVTLYSPSGIAPVSGTLPTTGYGDAYVQISNNYYNINKILKFEIINETKPKSYETIMEFCENYKNIFGTDQYYNSALSSIDVTFASALLGSVIDDTVANVNFVCTISLLPAILIIIILMSYMMVVESRKLVALLKVLGFSNWSNTITLSTVQFVVVGLSILLGYGIGFAILSMMKAFAFNFLSIIINPVIPLWTIGATLGVLALIVATITLTIFLNLRKTNPAQEIAIR